MQTDDDRLDSWNIGKQQQQHQLACYEEALCAQRGYKENILDV